jgi:hypothetical protein
MMTLNKNEFLQQGFYIRESENHLAVTTPQTFISGDPAKFWVVQDFEDLLFNDYGFSQNALNLSLPNPEKTDEVIKSILEKLDSKISFDGFSLTRKVKQEQAGVAMGEFLNLYAMLTNYQPKNIAQQDVMEILDNILIYLNKKYRGLNVERNVKFTGLSGGNHKFAFQADHKLIDFAAPNSKTTGSLLRKIQDVKAVYDDFEFSVILDDTNKKTFEKESRILSTVSSITPYSIVRAA